MALTKQLMKQRDVTLEDDLAFIRALKGSRPDVKPLSKSERNRLAEQFFREKGL
ncbi:MAG: hypothetical protein AABY13_06000 [Nanoarchaeota archaeon]